MKNYKFIISGKVQGVYYRKSVALNANKLNFSGMIKNLSNGNVEAVVSCEDERVVEFIKILKEGSLYSKVTDIKQSIVDKQCSNGFKVVY